MGQQRDGGNGRHADGRGDHVSFAADGSGKGGNQIGGAQVEEEPGHSQEQPGEGMVGNEERHADHEADDQGGGVADEQAHRLRAAVVVGQYQGDGGQPIGELVSRQGHGDGQSCPEGLADGRRQGEAVDGRVDDEPDGAVHGQGGVGVVAIRARAVHGMGVGVENVQLVQKHGEQEGGEHHQEGAVGIRLEGQEPFGYQLHQGKTDEGAGGKGEQQPAVGVEAQGHGAAGQGGAHHQGHHGGSDGKRHGRDGNVPLAIGTIHGVSEGVRLDVWLDVSCLARTRSQAKSWCDGGKVEVNGTRAKAHRPVCPGDRIAVTVAPGFRREVVVQGVAERHLPKAEARALYLDVTPPPTAEELELRQLRRLAPPPAPPRGAGRPEKRDRRHLERLRGR